MFLKRIFFILFIPFLIFSFSSEEEAFDKGIRFHEFESFASIKEMAKKEDKPIFIDFYALWCGPCIWMDDEVFSNEYVREFMNEHFINYKINIDTREGKAIANQYDIKHLPSSVIITAQGKVLGMESNYMNKNKFMKFAFDSKFNK